MNTDLAPTQPKANVMAQLDANTLFSLVTKGDLSKLTQDQQMAYYTYRCTAAGLDPSTKPFDIIAMQGKTVLYATKECSAQLTEKHKLSASVMREEIVSDVYKVTVRIEGSGRHTDDIGCVTIKGVLGDALCNAMMKATTKAKRRAVLSHCGLGLVDESELETIPQTPPKPVMQIPQRMTPNVEGMKKITATVEMPRQEPQEAPEPLVVPENAPEGPSRPALTLVPEGVEVDHYPAMKKITDPQRKRLFAIYRKSGWTDQQVKDFLYPLSITSSKLIPMNMYDQIVEAVQQPPPKE